MRLGAIIQARMGSTRLRGKVLMEIRGKPMLDHIVERVRKAVPDVFIVTPPDDIEIIYFAQTRHIPYSLDPKERDVLGAYYDCATKYGLENIVRVTGDNPLIDPLVIKRIIAHFNEHKFDYLSNCRIKATYPIGCDVEVFSYLALQKANMEAKEPYEREHVTPYIYRHPELFKVGNLENDRNLSHLRWTVDTDADLQFVRYVYSQLYRGQIFGMKEVLSLCKGISQ